MGLLDNLFGKKKGIVISAPVSGECIPLAKVNDPTFSEEVLGKGAAIIPDSNKVVAPADGTIDMIFPTGHAFTMTTNDKAEILVHIGIDTVQLKGKYFTKHVLDGAEVKKGDLIIEADFDEIKKEGFDTVIPMVICNSDSYKEVRLITEGAVTTGQEILNIENA